MAYIQKWKKKKSCKSIVEYYKDISRVMSKEKVTYLYISPNELAEESGCPAEVFGISTMKTRDGKPKDSYLCGQLLFNSKVALFLKTIKDTLN